MAQGAHFLSDVIFAGVFMALTVLVMRRLMLGEPGSGVLPEGDRHGQG
jgi:membrane-associated PAP2 superfamily phosphatase